MRENPIRRPIGWARLCGGALIASGHAWGGDNATGVRDALPSAALGAAALCLVLVVSA